MPSTSTQNDGFSPYQEGEDEIACTYDTYEEYEAAMQAWVKQEE